MMMMMMSMLLFDSGGDVGGDCEQCVAVARRSFAGLRTHLSVSH